MRWGFLVLWVGGCYEQRDVAAEVDPAGGACEHDDAVLEPEERGPITVEEIPAFVEGRGELIEEGDGILRCLPDDPESDEQYGCRAEDGRCVATPDRVRVRDGMMVVSLGATCAEWNAPEVRSDGVPVAPNRVLWTMELRIPVRAVEPGRTIELWDTPCASVTFRIRDWVNLETEACGHDPLVVEEEDGDRTVWCRDEWRTFRADVGVIPGLLAHSRAAFSAADVAEGDRFTLDMNMAGCGQTALAMVGADGTAVPTNCCAGHAERGLTWTIGPGGMLQDGPLPYLGGYCCVGLDLPFPNANCGNGDPGWW
jgi:hypothetical protein